MRRRLIVVMGVSGSGKTTVGKALHQAIGGHFVEADDFHSPSNIDKMSSGTPLSDDDRRDWIRAIVDHINAHADHTFILACSALTSFVQSELGRAEGCDVTWFHLESDRDSLTKRMAARDHFMPASLLESQFAALHPPAEAIPLNSGRPVNELVEICKGVLLQSSADE